MPEIMNQSATYYSPAEEENLKEKIEDMFLTLNVKAEVNTTLFQKFNWPDCANKTINIYKEQIK